eukprot:580633-Amphidinium_carterae.1
MFMTAEALSLTTCAAPNLRLGIQGEPRNTRPTLSNNHDLVQSLASWRHAGVIPRASDHRHTGTNQAEEES